MAYRVAAHSHIQSAFVHHCRSRYARTAGTCNAVLGNNLSPKAAVARCIGTLVTKSESSVDHLNYTARISCTYQHYSLPHGQYSSIPITRHNNDRFASTIADLLVKENIEANNEIQQRGDEVYKFAVDALQKSAAAKQDHEDKLLQEQFNAMKKQKQRTQQRTQDRAKKQGDDDPRLARLNNEQLGNQDKKEATKDRAAGVAVVRTIVKQSNAVYVDNFKSSSAKQDDSSKGKKGKSKVSDEEHWQQRAQKYMEEAAFRYGHKLALVRLGNEALERAKNSDSDSKSTPLIDRERCQGWVDDSPINLATILELSNMAEDGNKNNAPKDAGLPSPYRILALYLYEEAGNQGSAEGWYNLAHLLWDGPKKMKAIAAFHNAIELGDADAMYFIASQYLSYDEGSETEENEILSTTHIYYGPSFIERLKMEKGMLAIPEDAELPLFLLNGMEQHGYKLLHLAAHGHSHGPALHHIALLHHQNDNSQEFGRLLFKAADTGNPDSLFLLGHCYYFGSDGYDKDFKAALDNFLAAANNGHIDAMVSAGALLHQGVFAEDGRTVIVERDQQRAFDLYQQAGELGSIEGWRNVVSCYATGQGVPKCLDTAKYIANTMLKDDKNN